MENLISNIVVVISILTILSGIFCAVFLNNPIIEFYVYSIKFRNITNKRVKPFLSYVKEINYLFSLEDNGEYFDDFNSSKKINQKNLEQWKKENINLVLKFKEEILTMECFFLLNQRSWIYKRYFFKFLKLKNQVNEVLYTVNDVKMF